MQPLYDPEAVRPMWEELAQCGVTPLKTAADVDAVLEKPGTALIVVNSALDRIAADVAPRRRHDALMSDSAARATGS